MIAIQCSERNGKLVTAQLVSDTDEIVLITTGGVLIRTRVSEIREAGRSTQGVKLINLDENETLAGLVRLAEPPEVNGDTGNGDTGNGDGGNGDGTQGEGANGDAAGGAAPAADAARDEPEENGPEEPPGEPGP